MRRKEDIISALFSMLIGVMLIVMKGQVVSIAITVFAVIVLISAVIDLVHKLVNSAVVKAVIGVCLLIFGWVFVSVALYLLLGLVGLPVFAGFRGGAAALLDPTGGFLWGFLLGALVYWLLEKTGRIPAMVGCLAAVYLCGSFWFSHYTGTDLLSAMAVSVLPWLIPDGVKLVLANQVAGRIRKSLRLL